MFQDPTAMVRPSAPQQHQTDPTFIHRLPHPQSQLARGTRLPYDAMRGQMMPRMISPQQQRQQQHHIISSQWPSELQKPDGLGGMHLSGMPRNNAGVMTVTYASELEPAHPPHLMRSLSAGPLPPAGAVQPHSGISQPVRLPHGSQHHKLAEDIDKSDDQFDDILGTFILHVTLHRNQCNHVHKYVIIS